MNLKMKCKKFFRKWAMTRNTISPSHKSGAFESNLMTLREHTSLHASLCPLLSLAQCFGILPVNGITEKCVKKLYFHPRSYRAIYAYVVLLSMVVMALLSIIHMTRSLSSDTFSVLGGLGAATAGAIFYGNAVLATLLFLCLSKRWSSFMKYWSEVEFCMNYSIGYFTTDIIRLQGFPVHVLSSIVLLLAFVEHGLSIAINLKTTQSSDINWLARYTLHSHEFIFTTIDYTLLRGLFVFIISKVATFTWNFTDLFIMIMCQALTQRFREFNAFVLAHEGKVLRRSSWREIREQYVALASLTRLLNHNIAAIILLSFSNNIYFICLQLLNGISPPTAEVTLLQSVYFWGSFIFLVGRTGAVILHASNVHHVSRGALPAVFACPSIAYCEETARLQQHMCGEELAITGLGLFNVTRNFLLAVAGAIATYEVVLLQFNVAMTTSCAVVPSSTATASALAAL